MLLQKSKFDVTFYDLADGTEPAKDFILALPLKIRAKVYRAVDMLKDNGVDLREPYSKFYKKTQKTPPSEIDRAKKYRADYLNREENQQ